MVDALFVIALVGYCLAGSVLLACLLGRGRRSVTVGVAWLAAAAAAHAGHDLTRWIVHGVGPFGGLAPSLSSLGLLVVVTFLYLRGRAPRLEFVGAFVAPVALVALAASRLLAADVVVHGGAMLALHIGSSMLAVAAFTVACVMAVAYLLQERQVKTRRLGGLFRRLPALDVLDTLGYQCIAVGLPALTLGVVTGHVVAARGLHGRGLPWQQYFAMIAWALFAAVTLMRLLAGWRGRRAAIGTILGYASALLVLLFYSVRGGVA